MNLLKATNRYGTGQRSPVLNWKLAILVVSMIVTASLAPAARPAFMILLTIWAFTGATRAIKALFIEWILVFLNQGLAGGPLGETSDMLMLALRWLLICAAIMHLLVAMPTRTAQWGKVVAQVLFAGTLLAIINVFSSGSLAISILKLIQFSVWLIAIIGLFEAQRGSAEYWNSWLTTFFLAILLASLPLTIAEVGYRGLGFQGVMGQPQAFGVLVAILAAWFSIRFLLNAERNWIVATGALLSIVYIFLSASRNAALAAVFSIGLTLFLTLKGGSGAASAKSNSSRRSVALVLILGIMAFLPIASMFLAPEALNFLTKGEGGPIAESFQNSRGELIEASWENFESHPLLGIGFGIPSNLFDLYLQLDPIFGLPISASVEKGILVVGMLEENGILGSIVLVSLCFFLIRPALSLKHPHIIALVLACLFVNLGEAVLFSVGGVGFLIWMLIAFARINRTEI